MSLNSTGSNHLLKTPVTRCMYKGKKYKKHIWVVVNGRTCMLAGNSFCVLSSHQSKYLHHDAFQLWTVRNECVTHVIAELCIAYINVLESGGVFDRGEACECDRSMHATQSK